MNIMRPGCQQSQHREFLFYDEEEKQLLHSLLISYGFTVIVLHEYKMTSQTQLYVTLIQYY